MKPSFYRAALHWILILISFPVTAATVTVEIRNNFFSPASVTIQVGDTVTWIQRGSNHDTVSNDGLWSSGLMRLNETFSFTFNNPGTFRYFCTPHRNAGMLGTVNVQGAANTPPSVTLTAPTSGTAFLTTDSITFSATATDNGSIAKVDFFSGSTLLSSDNSSPYSITASLPAGSHSITAKATDNLGASTTSAAITILVSAPNTPPSVSLTSPTAGSTFLASDTITFSATATDDGSIAKVDFFAGASLIGSDNSSPYSITASLPAGTHSITAKATDNGRATTTSDPITITVKASVAPPQFVSVTRSGNSIVMMVSGTTGVPHVLEATPDFLTWSAVATGTPMAGSVSFTQPIAEVPRFYRVVVR